MHHRAFGGFTTGPVALRPDCERNCSCVHVSMCPSTHATLLVLPCRCVMPDWSAIDVPSSHVHVMPRSVSSGSQNITHCDLYFDAFCGQYVAGLDMQRFIVKLVRG